MKVFIKIHTFLFLISAFFTPAFSAYKVKDSVKIDWRNGEIKATAFYSGEYSEEGTPHDFSASDITPTAAKMTAYKKAKENAAILIADSFRNIPLDGKNTLSSVITGNNETTQRIGDLIPSKLITKETPDGFFGAKCEAVLKFSQILSAISYDFPQYPFPEFKDNPFSTEYTSLIVDARGEMQSPVLFPTIITQTGIEIYGKRFINPKYMLKQGMAAYCTNEQEAKRHTFAGDHPYFSRAVGSMPGSCIISIRDARKILSSKKTVEKLKQCRVIIIIDSKNRETGITQK